MEANLTVLRAEASPTAPSGTPSPGYGVTMEFSGVQSLDYYTGQSAPSSAGNFPVKLALTLGLPSFEGESNPWPEKAAFPFDYRKQYRITIEEV